MNRRNFLNKTALLLGVVPTLPLLGVETKTPKTKIIPLKEIYQALKKQGTNVQYYNFDREFNKLEYKIFEGKRIWHHDNGINGTTWKFLNQGIVVEFTQDCEFIVEGPHYIFQIQEEKQLKLKHLLKIGNILLPKGTIGQNEVIND